MGMGKHTALFRLPSWCWWVGGSLPLPRFSAFSGLKIHRLIPISGYAPTASDRRN